MSVTQGVVTLQADTTKAETMAANGPDGNVELEGDGETWPSLG